MGKGNRTNNQKIDQKKQAMSAAQAKYRRNNIIAIVCTVLVVALLGSLVTYSKLTTSGFFMRRTTAASTENFTVDQAMATYMFYQDYQTNSYIYQYYYGVDNTQSLKTQACSLMAGGTWFDFFISSLKPTISTMLAFCEEAQARGITLQQEDYDHIDEQIDSLKEAAKEAGYNTSYYIQLVFGSGVKEKDVRAAMEMSLLYSRCADAIVEGYNYTAEDYKAYLEANRDDFVKVDYATMRMTTSDGATDEDVTPEMIADYAQRFTQVKDKAAFDELAFEYLRNVLYKDDTETTDEAIREEIAGFTVEGATKADSEFSTWAFADGRKVNDVYTAAGEEGETQDVYILLSTPAIEEYKTANVRHILLSTESFENAEAAKAEAERLLAEWQGGAATADSFAELAKAHSEDTSAEDGGLIENIAKGQTVDTFEAWLFADGRKEGDSGIVESEYGYHVMYLDSFGMTAWEAAADSALKNDKFAEDEAALLEKYPTTFNNEAMFGIDA